MTRRRLVVGGVVVLMAAGLWAIGVALRDERDEPRRATTTRRAPTATAITTPPFRAECPDETNRLGFISARGPREHVFVVDIRRPGSMKRVTDLPGLAQTPTWSPDGSRLAFQWLEPGSDSPGIYIMNGEDTRPRLLVEEAATPAWSPDGHTLAVANLSAEERGISLVDVRDLGEPGSPPVRVLTESGAMVPEEWPQWTPDGTRILFTSQRGGSSDVWITDLEGRLQVLTPDPALDTTPSMSPDGRHIVFGSNRDADSEGGGDIYVMDSTGGRATRITHTQDNYDPTWSPDGRFIAFTSQRPGHSAIYVMKPDGSARRRVDRGRHPSAMAAWVGGCRTVTQS